MAQQALSPRPLAFFLLFVASLVFTSWLASNLLLPDELNPVLSAKPAPAHPAIANRWAYLAPMQRSHESDGWHGDSLAALLARAGIGEVEADAALDALRTQFDPRTLKVSQKFAFSENGRLAHPILRRAARRF